MSVAAYPDERDRSIAPAFDGRWEHCATCRFWLPEKLRSDEDSRMTELTFGVCRRNPPRLIEHLVRMNCQSPSVGSQTDMEELFTVSQHFDATAFPGTFHSEWCGEFQWLPKLQPTEAPVC